MAKEYAKSSFVIFEEATVQLGVNSSALAASLGYSAGAPTAWRLSGSIPKVAAIAIEGLLRRAKLYREDHGTLIVKANNSKLESVKSVLTALGCTVVEL